MVNVKRILTYTLLGALFTIIYGELMAVFIADNAIFLEYWLPISVYYVVISFIFSLFIFRIPPMAVVVVFFVYGVVMETFVFGNINGFTDVLGIFFFGNQYLSIFGVPYLVTKKLMKGK